jgi:hypothetical protein
MVQFAGPPPRQSPHRTTSLCAVPSPHENVPRQPSRVHKLTLPAAVLMVHPKLARPPRETQRVTLVCFTSVAEAPPPQIATSGLKPETTLASSLGESQLVLSQQRLPYFALNVHAAHPLVEAQSVQHACAFAVSFPLLTLLRSLPGHCTPRRLVQRE